MSSDIFQRIQSSAIADDENFIVDHKVRWLRRLDDADLRLMSDAKVEAIPLGLRSFAAKITHEGQRHYCFSGLPDSENKPTGLISIDATPGLFSAAIVSLEIPSIATSAQARNVLEGNSSDTAGYDGHDLSLIAPLFPSMSYFKADQQLDAIYFDSIERVAGSFFARGYSGYPLAISKDTLKKFSLAFENGPDGLPYYLLLQGLLSSNWSNLYLELYRAIEQLYSVPRLSALLSRVKHKGTLADLAETLESVLSWRPKEEESLTFLLNSIPKPMQNELLAALSVKEGDIGEATGDKCASRIYQIRNSHVHFRPALKAHSFSSDQWDEIVRAMCSTVEEVYSTHGSVFHAVHEA